MEDFASGLERTRLGTGAGFVLSAGDNGVGSKPGGGSGGGDATPGEGSWVAVGVLEEGRCGRGLGGLGGASAEDSVVVAG